MADLDGFTVADGTDAPPIWTAVFEGGEVIVAMMSDGSIQLGRFEDHEDPLLITFSAYDSAVAAVIHNWRAGALI